MYIFLILNKYLSFKNKKENAPPKKVFIIKKVKFKDVEKNKNKDKKLYKGFITEISKNYKKVQRKQLNTVNSINLINSKNILKKSTSSNNNINNSKDIIISLKLLDENNNIKEKTNIERLNNANENKIELNSKDEFNINMEEYLETDLQSLVFEEVIERDKRTFCSFLIEKLKYDLLIVNIIYFSLKNH